MNGMDDDDGNDYDDVSGRRKCPETNDQMVFAFIRSRLSRSANKHCY